MEFRPLRITDRDNVERFLSLFTGRGCEFTFTSLYCWNDAYPTEIWSDGRRTVLRMTYDDRRTAYIFPFGNEMYSSLLPMIERDAAERDTALAFYLGNASLEPMLRTLYPDFGAFYLRAYSDYVYLRERLVSLRGSKLQPKRNLINRFNSLYQYEYGVIEETDADQCLALLKLWAGHKVSEGEVTDSYMREVEDERLSIETLFRNFRDLDVLGGKIRIDGRIAAFCLGSAISDDTFCVHFEKVDETYTGLYQVINQQFAMHLPDRFRFVNRENDLGIHGLRKAKESYHPALVLNKYIFTRMTEVMIQIRELWLKSFEEDMDTDVEQFLLTRFDERNLVAEYADGRMVGMLHIIPFGRQAYFYAIATDPEFRHRGIGRRIVGKALERCRREGYTEAVLIPDGEMARRWYETMGFSGKYPIRFNTSDEFDFCSPYDDYDYGTGDHRADMAMTLGLTEDAPPRNDGEPMVLSDIQDR